MPTLADMTYASLLSPTLADQTECLSVADESVSGGELVARAAAVAARIRGAQVVAVRASPTLDTVVAVVGALVAGVPIVPIPPDAGPMERGHILADSGAQLMLGAHDWPDVMLPTVALDGEGTWSNPEPPMSAPALIVYTSGTTGLPKGVVLSRAALAAGIDGLADAWAWVPDDVLAHGLPLFHVHGLVLGVLGPLRVGSRLVHTGRPTPVAYAAAGASIYFGVPTVWGRVCAEPAAAAALSGARLLVSGSAALPVGVFERLKQITGHAPIERYGMTETLITLSTRADGERRPGWVGVPIDGVRSRLIGDDGAVIDHDGDTMGELQIRGATMFDGYLNRSEATTDSFENGWFRTGDAAIIDGDGFHRIVGRQSVDIIKTGGYKVGAGEVEAALLDHPSVREAAVVGVDDGDLGQRVVAYVVGDGVVPDALIAHVAALLSVHKRPREIRLVDELPRNAMGKVVKAQLR